MAKRRVRKTIDPNEIRLSDLDQQYYGPEPKYAEGEVTEDNRKSLLGSALNWYSKILDTKKSVVYIQEWLVKEGRDEEVKAFKKAPDHLSSQTCGAVCRMAVSRGWPMSDKEKEFIEERSIRPSVKWYNEQQIIEENTDEKEKPKRKSIQDIMKEKLLDAGGEIDGLIDLFIEDEVKLDSKFKNSILFILNEFNPLATHIPMLVADYEKEKEEIEEALLGKDEQLVEAYSCFTKTKLKNFVKAYEAIISTLNAYATLKIQSRAKRKRKVVPVEKQVSKLKYQKLFECPSTKLKLESVKPTLLHHAKEAWCYDTQKRKLHHYMADEFGGSLFVKGNTLYGFDPILSAIKTLRKPHDQIKEIMGSKPAARKYFDSIKAVEVKPKGRFNDQMIILKAF
jgi:hypothetical protein